MIQNLNKLKLPIGLTLAMSIIPINSNASSTYDLYEYHNYNRYGNFICANFSNFKKAHYINKISESPLNREITNSHYVLVENNFRSGNDMLNIKLYYNDGLLDLRLRNETLQEDLLEAQFNVESLIVNTSGGGPNNSYFETLVEGMYFLYKCKN